MLANVQSTWARNAICVALVIALVGFFGFAVMLIVKGHRWFTALADRAQMRAFEGVTISHAPGPGLVGVVFHAYSGVFAFTRQVEYRFWADPSDARLVLARLHRFNLTWGFFAYGALIIPILSLGNYWVQQARIKEQAAQTTVGQVRSNLMLKGWRYE